MLQHYFHMSYAYYKFDNQMYWLLTALATKSVMKTVVIMVIRITIGIIRMTHWRSEQSRASAEQSKCRADLNFEVNGAIGTIVIKWDLILFG